MVIGELKREPVLQVGEFGGGERRMKFGAAQQADDLSTVWRATLDTVQRREPACGFNAQPLT